MRRGVAIEIEELQTGALQPFVNHLAETLHELIAEAGVVFELLAQADAIEGDRPRELEGASVVVPDVRRKEPRPAEDVALTSGLNGDRAAPRGEELYRDLARPDQKKAIGRPALTEEELAGLEADIARAASDETRTRRDLPTCRD